MKLYEVNQAIEEIFEQMVDSETGEILEDELFMEKLSDLQMEKSRILVKCFFFFEESPIWSMEKCFLELNQANVVLKSN